MNRIWTVGVSVLLVLFGGGCQPAAPTGQPAASPSAPVPVAPVIPAVQPLLRWHSLGLEAVGSANGGSRVQEVMALPESALVKSNALAKLARNLPVLLFPEATTNKDQATKLKPLLEDIISYESKVEWVSESPLRWRMAVKIPVEHTGLWTANLHDLLVRGEFIDKIPRTNITDTSVTVGYSSEATYRYGLKDSWVTVERAEPGYDWSALAQSETKTEPNAWLALELQTKLLPHASGVMPADLLPYARLTMSGKGENQKSQLSLKFPQALGLVPQPWRVPTNTIQDPVISFTAMQGIGGWWSRQEWLKPLGLASAPQQVYTWAQSEMPFQTFFAFPAAGASNLVASSLDRWTNEFNASISNQLAGRVLSRTNELIWTGLPVIVPYLKAAPEPKDDHLLFGFFPMSPSSTNLPPELLQQFVGRTNSIYYDWEITEARINQWIQFSPLLFMSANRLPVANSAVPYQWLRAIAPKLGNTVTEAELAAPDEIKVRRNSPAGFSGWELYLLTRWLDQASFPNWDKQVGPAMGVPSVPTGPPAPKN
jgi:hypothetical protein